MPQTQWKRGDRLVHAARPEWGVGEVTSVQAGTDNGKATQTLTVRFTRAGSKTLSAPPAPLEPAEEVAPLDRALAERAGFAEQAAVEEVMTVVPERARDPFASMAERLRFTLDLYRFTESGAPLIDWAAAQSGLADPLSRFSRHELEQLFSRFRLNLDNHLRNLVDQVRRSDPGLLEKAAAEAPPEARFALRRADGRR
jgi:hypothetical protein